MKLEFLYLVGGPLDGLYMPANPKLEGFPSEIAIFHPRYGWQAYEDPEAGGTSKVDVYKIVQAGDGSFTQKPKTGKLHEMRFRSALNLKEVQEIERMVSRRKFEQ